MQFHLRRFSGLDGDRFQAVVSQMIAVAEAAVVQDSTAAVVKPKRELSALAEDDSGTASTIATLLEGAGSPGWTPPAMVPTVISVIGAPGSGRSTQCASIAALLNCECISAMGAVGAAVSVGSPAGAAGAAVSRTARVCPLRSVFRLRLGL